MATKILGIWTDTLDCCGRAWWIEVLTVQPNCTYYFGPFVNANQAERAVKDYVEDLENESAQGIQTQVKRCNPVKLTIDHDTGESS